jgi:hypothetical protein
MMRFWIWLKIYQLYFKKNDTLITKKSGQKIALIGALANDKNSPLRS